MPWWWRLIPGTPDIHSSVHYNAILLIILFRLKSVKCILLINKRVLPINVSISNGPSRSFFYVMYSLKDYHVFVLLKLDSNYMFMQK